MTELLRCRKPDKSVYCAVQTYSAMTSEATPFKRERIDTLRRTLDCAITHIGRHSCPQLGVDLSRERAGGLLGAN